MRRYVSLQTHRSSILLSRQALRFDFSTHSRLPRSLSSVSLITNLHKFLRVKQVAQLRLLHSPECSGQQLESREFIVCDIVTVRLLKQENEDPGSFTLGKHDRTIHIFVQAFFENATAEVVGLTRDNFLDCPTQLLISNASLPGCLGEPAGLEGAIGRHG